MPINSPTGFLDITNATLRTSNLEAQNLKINGGNIYVTVENTSFPTASTINYTNPTSAFTTTSNIEVGNANLFVDTTTSNVGIGTNTPEYTLDVDGEARFTGNATATTFIGSLQGNAQSSTQWVTGRTLTVSGAVTGTSSLINGNQNSTLVTTLADIDTGKITTGILPVARGGTGVSTSTGTGSVVLSNAPTFTGDATFDTDTLHIDATNDRVGVGTVSPDRNFHVVGTTRFDGDFEWYKVGENTSHANYGSNRDWYIRSGSTAGKVIIQDSGGNVGIGTTSPNEKLQVNGNIGINWNSATRIIMKYDDSYRHGLVLDAGTRMMTLFSTTNDTGGGIAFNTRIGLGSSDTDYGTEKMRITGSGNVGINKTAPAYKLDIQTEDAIHVEMSNTLYETKVHGGSLFIRNPSTSGGFEHMIINNHTTGSHTTAYIQFRRGTTGNGSAIGTITGNGSTISYGGQSDYRVKENIVPMPISGLDTINNLRPKRFNFIGYPDDIYDGFIAHELQEHIPMAVTGVKDEMRGRGNVVKVDDESIIVKEDVSEPDSLEEGTKWVKLSEVPVYQNVDLSKIVTYLVKAVQELSEENQTLKTRLDALENA